MKTANLIKKENRKKRQQSAALGLILFLVLPVSGYAQEPASGKGIPSLSLPELFDTAMEKNPEILAAKAEWDASKNRIWIVSWLPDPMGGYDIMGAMTETRVGPQKQRFMVSQEVPFPLKLWERGRAAHSEAKAAQARYEALKRKIQNQLEELYYELYYVDASIDTIHEIKTILQKIEQAAQGRYSSLEGSQRDVAKTQAEVSMSLEKLFMLEQKRESLKAMILAILDEDPMQELGRAQKPEKSEMPYSLVELVNLAIANRQEIKEMEALAETSGHKVRLAKLANIPDINVGFQYTSVGGGTTSSDMDGRDSWMFPLRFNIPLWQNRIIPEIKEANHLRDSARAKLLAVKNTTFYEVKDAYYRYEAANKISQLYETAVIPQAEIALRADQAGYESNKTDFLDLIDSERVYLNAKLNYIRFFSETLKARADMVRASGIDLKPHAGMNERENHHE